MPSEVSSDMASGRDTQALCDIRDNIRLAQGFVAGRDLEAFKADRMAVYATIRALEIISEASRKLSDETKIRHDHLPWKQIAGSGNIYRHDYENVTESLIWRTVLTSLPVLLRMAEEELKS